MKETYESIFLKYKLHFKFLNNINGILIIFSTKPPILCFIDKHGITEPQCCLICIDWKEIRTGDIDDCIKPFHKTFDQILKKVISIEEFIRLCQKEKIKRI